MKNVGLHIRLTTTLAQVGAYAANLKVPLFQCFLIHQGTNQFIHPTDQEIQEFLTDWRPQFQQLYVHGSYWINLASFSGENKVLMRELTLAKRLEFTHIIIHPGSAKNSKDKKEGICNIAKSLNYTLKKEQDIKIILENTAHAGLSIGGDLQDFYYLRERLDHPEKVSFCIDTSHAHSYGYDILTPEGQVQFLELVNKTMGLANIAVIHLNDTKQTKGSRIDRHENIGDGMLADILQPFLAHESLKNIPIILELPVSSVQEEEKMLKAVRNW